MLLVCEKLEITIILYILYIRIILKGTEHVEVERNIRTVVVEMLKINTFSDWSSKYKDKSIPNCLHFANKMFSYVKIKPLNRYFIREIAYWIKPENRHDESVNTNKYENFNSLYENMLEEIKIWQPLYFYS